MVTNMLWSCDNYVCASSQVAPDCKVIIFPKDELDKANKDKKHFPPNFQVCKHSWHDYWVGGASHREGLPLTGVESNYTHAPTLPLTQNRFMWFCLRLQVMRWMLTMMYPLVMRLILRMRRICQTRTMRRSGIHPNLSECCRCVGECVCVRLVRVLWGLCQGMKEGFHRYPFVVFSCSWAKQLVTVRIVLL